MSEFNIGDKVTVTRGKDRGQVGEVRIAAQDGNCAVALADGRAVIINEASLKAPDQPTVTKAKLIETLDNLGIDSAPVLEKLGNEISGWD